MRRPEARRQSAGPEPRRLGRVLEFMQQLWALHHGLQLASKRMRRRFGVTGPQRLVIRLVGKFPDISAGELAHLLHVHPSTLTGVLKRLEGQGLITRRSDPRDGRRSLFHLRTKGRTLDGSNRGTVEDAVRAAVVRLAPSKIRAAEDVFGAVAGELARVTAERRGRR